MDTRSFNDQIIERIIVYIVHSQFEILLRKHTHTQTFTKTHQIRCLMFIRYRATQSGTPRVRKKI